MSSDYQTNENKRDPELWAVAQRRVSFKYHAVSYVVMNAFFWIVWVLTGRENDHNGLPWAIWPSIGWGIGLFFHFVGAYVLPKNNATAREYEKLINQKK